MSGHLPADCCCHVFSRACPVDCLRVVLGTATFHALARAECASFTRPATVGHVLDLWQGGRLGLAAGIGPRRLGEIEAGLVLAGFVLTDDTESAPSPPPSRGACASDDLWENPSCWSSPS
jgi:hypothetical protein